MKLLLLLALSVTQTEVDRSYDVSARVPYVQSALEAVHGTEPHTLENAYRYIQAMERNACLSSFHRLRIECLLQKMRANCKGKPAQREKCRIYSDLIITNLLGESTFVSKERRLIILQQAADYKAELRREVQRRYGTMVADFQLRSESKCTGEALHCLAERIDDYCIRRADVGQLSWQYCTSAIVWFMGTAAHSS